MRRKALLICAALALCSCSIDRGQGAKGSVKITVGAARAKTIAPSIPTPSSYTISLAGPTSVSPIRVTSSSTTVELAAGTWTVSVLAYDANGAAIASGSLEGILVSVGATTEASISLHAITSGTGAIDLTITWPSAQAVSSSDSSLSLSMGGTSPSASLVWSDSSLSFAVASCAAGDYLLGIELKKDSTTALYSNTFEVQVYSNLSTSATIALSDEDFTAIRRIIDHTNCAPSLSDAQIAAAATLKVYFEHASTGQDIFGNSNTDCSAGLNNDVTASCGLMVLHAADSRFAFSRAHFISQESEFGTESTNNDPSWFSTHTGLQTCRRNNPAPAKKLSGFVGMSASMRAAVDVAMFKFCWIDVWPSTGGYVSNGATFAQAVITAISGLEASNTASGYAVVIPYWTMPLQSNQSYAEREAYNSAIRAYCAANKKWLIDIADIECHAADGTKRLDSGREIADSSYVTSDGGHLSQAGSLRMARAYWALIANIAEVKAGTGQ
jgi:hypothetical protein